MSSVLKALQRQSSPLVQQPAPIQLRSATSKRSLTVGQSLLWLLTVAAASLILWWGVSSWKALTVPALSEPTPVVEPVNYIVGEAQPIRVPRWPEATPAVEPATEVVQQPEVTSPEAVNLEQVSPELLMAFEDALSDTGNNSTVQSIVPRLSDLSVSFQRQIPSFNYEGHQYSSRAASRWIRIGGQRLYEQDVWQGLQILKIAPSHVILSKNNQAFQQPALEDWTTP